jgi:hypothetical protein
VPHRLAIKEEVRRGQRFVEDLRSEDAFLSRNTRWRQLVRQEATVESTRAVASTAEAAPLSVGKRAEIIVVEISEIDSRLQTTVAP